MSGLKMKVAPLFPANVIGGIGINVTKQSGAFNFDLNYSKFGQVGAVPVGSQALLFNPGTNSYALAAAALLGAPGASPGHIPGEPGAGNAAVGEIGQYLTATGATGTLASGTPTNICALPIPAGDWDLYAGYVGGGGGGPSVTQTIVSLNTVSGASNVQPGYCFYFRGVALVDPILCGPIGPVRVSLAAPQTWYLNTTVFYSPGTFAVNGAMFARRAR